MRLRLRLVAGLIGISALVGMALTIAPLASAAIAPGALHCPLPKYNPNKYALVVGVPVTCTIDHASDASGQTTVPVFIKTSGGNITVTGTVSGSGSSTKITFTFTAPAGSCQTAVVAYINTGNNSNNSIITPGRHEAAGFGFVDASGNPAQCGAPPPPGPPTIFFGYADNYRGAPGAQFPSPWEGDANVTFIGCGYPGGACPPRAAGGFFYDSGAIRIDNLNAGAMTVSNATVDFPGLACANFAPWPGLNVTIPAGGTLILTETGTSGDPCGVEQGNYNFDTSDTWEAFFGGVFNCTNDGLIGQFHATINGTPMTVSDTGQYLNWGGLDPMECQPSPPSEMRPWLQVFP